MAREQPRRIVGPSRRCETPRNLHRLWMEIGRALAADAPLSAEARTYLIDVAVWMDSLITHPRHSPEEAARLIAAGALGVDAQYIRGWRASSRQYTAGMLFEKARTKGAKAEDAADIIAAELGVDRRTVFRWLKKKPFA